MVRLKLGLMLFWNPVGFSQGLRMALALCVKEFQVWERPEQGLSLFLI